MLYGASHQYIYNAALLPYEQDTKFINTTREKATLAATPQISAILAVPSGERALPSLFGQWPLLSPLTPGTLCVASCDWLSRDLAPHRNRQAPPSTSPRKSPYRLGRSPPGLCTGSIGPLHFDLFVQQKKICVCWKVSGNR